MCRVRGAFECLYKFVVLCEVLGLHVFFRLQYLNIISLLSLNNGFNQSIAKHMRKYDFNVNSLYSFKSSQKWMLLLLRYCYILRKQEMQTIWCWIESDSQRNNFEGQSFHVSEWLNAFVSNEFMKLSFWYISISMQLNQRITIFFKSIKF